MYFKLVEVLRLRKRVLDSALRQLSVLDLRATHGGAAPAVKVERITTGASPFSGKFVLQLSPVLCFVTLRLQACT